MQKQETAYTAWLNHILVPQSTGDECQDASEEALSLKWKIAQLKGVLVRTCRTDGVLKIAMGKVEAHIDKGHMRLHGEGSLLDDLRLRKMAVRTLMVYNPLWLRLALQVVVQRAVVSLRGTTPAPGEAPHLKAFLTACRGQRFHDRSSV